VCLGSATPLVPDLGHSSPDHGSRAPRRMRICTSTNPSRTCARSPTATTTSSPRPPGIPAGYWYAWPSTHIGHELVAAGMLILAGNGRGLPFDYDELERWTRVGYERGMRSRKGER
jgi:hypothetical protein